MPTSKKVRRALYSALPDCDGPIYELGSGWGHLLILLAKRYPRANVIGYETSWVPYLVSRLITAPFRNVQIYRRDFFTADLSQAGLLVCYLYRGAMDRLAGVSASLITHTFAVPGRKPNYIVEACDMYRTKIYFYMACHSCSCLGVTPSPANRLSSI